ncbi:maltose O-acetyltransferase [Alteromonas sp. RW2A1]|uniref:sugar O-acetyltransferase n=1 Tax=Alteromonas sp. RW2A1 TaxID=1917158 RepID=UPI000903B9F6|nr:sugar O-acetyltransferase [Alteromonas sp. RW2A1]APE05658.1 maltose O-acetyltransferase [Alteromonas sp. RW2A1]
MTEQEKMLAGELYFPSDKTLTALRKNCRKQLDILNSTCQTEHKKRTQLLKTLFGKTGKRLYIESTFKCDYGENILVGENFYANFNCVILDAARVTIGDNCMLAPQVGIYTATHPTDPKQRATGIEFAKPITLGDNCWVGGMAVINPGVTLGNNVVVASGAVVTKSFGDNVIIGGNPARVIKVIDTHSTE